MQYRIHERDADCAEWRKLEADARAGAKLGDDIRSHNICFDPDLWQPYTSALPEQAVCARSISRGDVFGLAAEQDSADGNWRLFCASNIWGRPSNGFGTSRFERIIRETPREELSAVIAEARARLGACGPLSAYAYLRGTGSACTVPQWGPAFFTKLLYFADTGSKPGSALILDNLTATVVMEISGLPNFVNERGESGRWTEYRYGVYLAWMNLVSAELDVAPDFLEYALFEDQLRRRGQGRRQSRTRPRARDQPPTRPHPTRRSLS